MTDTAHDTAKKIFAPFLLYLGGLLASSTVLVAAAISAFKDAAPYSDWQKALCGFIFWMAWTIIVATAGAAYIQHRVASKATSSGKGDVAVISLPIFFGLFAALHMIVFAARHHNPFYF